MHFFRASNLFQGFNVHDFTQYQPEMPSLRKHSDPSLTFVRPTLSMQIAVEGRYKTTEVLCMFNRDSSESYVSRYVVSNLNVASVRSHEHCCFYFMFMQHLSYEKRSNVEDHEVNNWFMVESVRGHGHCCFYFMFMQHLSYKKRSNVEDHEINNCNAFMIPCVSKLIPFSVVFTSMVVSSFCKCLCF